MRCIEKTCASCGQRFAASCGVEKFCSDACKFAESYDVAPSGCWNWRHGTDKDGYGVIKRKGSRPQRAHRFSFEAKNGPIPGSGVMVCHTCDNPSCVNPDHLFLGAAKHNKTDSVDKGRHVHGRGVYWKAKLTEEQVLAIRADERKRREVANDYGVTPENIDAIRTGKIWKHLL